MVEEKGKREGEGISFEDAMKRLEAIVEELGRGNLSLEDSLNRFQEGMELYKVCNNKLDEAEYKVELLIEKGGEGGELTVGKFEGVE
ncbi:MAG: exodeoxyribonuclease VII small subunit [Methanophagales archaeon]|nr:exodeoxyribonuclease VII small subunit [Methanophagales archaeon]